MDALRQRRQAAAEYSGGISNDVVYSLALRLCRKNGLGRDVVEYGPGLGYFFDRLREQGFAGRYTGLDLYPRPERLPADATWLQADLNDPAPLPDAAFDSVICLEVIICLENPRFLFREWARLLRPGGLLLLGLPNMRSLRSLSGVVFGDHFTALRGIAYPAIITTLLRLDLERICAETGFAPPEFHYTNHGVLPKVHYSWQTLTLGLAQGRLFSDNLILVTRRK